MKNKKLIRFLESFILLPLLPMTTMSVPVGGLAQAGYNVVSSSQAVLSQKLNIEADGSLALNQVIDAKAEELKTKAEAIDAYFKNYNMPLFGLGMKMVLEADKNGLDWRLLPAIAVRESTGGKFDCTNVTNNPFGWGSCSIGFKSIEQAIETVARNLGGNDPKTLKYYDNKTIKQILHAYNPPSIAPRYAEQVISIMNAIGKEDTLPPVTANT